MQWTRDAAIALPNATIAEVGQMLRGQFGEGLDDHIVAREVRLARGQDEDRTLQLPIAIPEAAHGSSWALDYLRANGVDVGSMQALHDLVARGEISAERYGDGRGRLKFRQSDLDAYIAVRKRRGGR